MVFSSNIAWPQCSLGSEEQCLPNGSLNCNTIVQVELFCEQEGKWGEVPFVETFMMLYQSETIQRKCNMHTIMIQKVPSNKEILKVLPKTQELRDE